MRKVTSEIQKALNSGTPKSVGNTRTDGHSVWLHNNKIVYDDGSVRWFTLSNWPTNTTRDRLNGLLDGVRVFQSEHEQFIHFGGKDYEMDSSAWYGVKDGRLICRSSNGSVSVLNIPANLEKNMNVRTHTCLACKHQWTSKVVMSQHSPAISGERTEQCPVCDSRGIASSPRHSTQLKYKISATYIENGQELLADRQYALGQYAGQTWTDRDEAEAVADALRADVGDVVDESVIYTVEEVFE